MDFFGRQDVARRNTLKLVVLFGLGVLAIVVVLNLAVGMGFVVFGLFTAQDDYGTLTSAVPPPTYREDEDLTSLARHRPEVFLWTTLATLALIGLGCAYKAMELSAGGPAVAHMLGGRLVTPETAGPEERVLLNIVEEMAIASGCRVPAVYVMDAEGGINAFAAGKSQSDAVIGVTRGALEQLSRDEMQGVIAHEFSHIVNRDMTLNVRMIALLHGIMCLAIAGYILLRSMTWGRLGGRGGGRNVGGAVALMLLLGAVMVVVGYLGVFFGRLVQAAVSRQREFLADAAAVQFTRNPMGLAGALAKLLRGTGRMESAQAGEAAHLMFAGLRPSWLGNLTATHPPLEQRIEAIAPGYLTGLGARGAGRSGPAVSSGGVAGVSSLSGSAAEVPIAVAVRAPSPRLLDVAARLLSEVPRELREAAGDAFSSRAVVLCLIFGSHTPEQRQQAVAACEGLLDAALAREIGRLLPMVVSLGPEGRLPLLDLCLEPLRSLSGSQAAAFRKLLSRAIWADNEVSLAEYCLYQVVMKALSPPRPAPRGGPGSVTALRHDIAALLAVVIRSASADSPQQFERALAAAMAQLDLSPEGQLIPGRHHPLEGDPVRLLDRAVTRIASAPIGVRRRVMQAVFVAVQTDGRVNVAEGELVRALGAVFEVPVPPTLAGL